MRHLFWKEWRETRWLPLIMTALTIVLNGVWAYALYRAHLSTTLGSHITINGHHDTGPAANTSIIVTGSGAILFAIWILSGALAGAGSFASEIGSGTLKFLLSLPVKREVLWRVKALTAIGTLSATLVLSGLCWFLMDAALYGPHFLLTARAAGVPVGFRADVVPVLEISFFALAAAFAVSTFVDRTISALLSVIVSGPVVYGLVYALEDWILTHLFPAVASGRIEVAIERTLLLLMIAALTIVSYTVFVQGGSLTTTRRFRIGAITGGAALAAVSGALAVMAPTLVR